MALHLRQVEVWSSPPLDELVCVVEEVKAKVKQRTGDGLAINGEVLLLKMPASSTGDECGEDTVGAELVLLVALLEVDLLADGVVEVELAIDHVVPCRGTGV